MPPQIFFIIQITQTLKENSMKIHHCSESIKQFNKNAIFLFKWNSMATLFQLVTRYQNWNVLLNFLLSILLNLFSLMIEDKSM